MNPSVLLSRIPTRYKVLLPLLIWGAAVLFMLRADTFGLDEAATRGLLLVWSFIDEVAHPVVVLGMPDFRAILYIPPALMWTGNLLAIKVLSLLVTAAAALLLYDWSAKNQNQEGALLAAGLMLISPLAISQIDSLGAGPFLLLIVGLGSWLDRAYRADPRPLGGWYASQVFLSALAVSLHPAGLAYPASLLWAWHNNPIDARQQRHFYTGILGAVVFVLLTRMGWGDLGWLHNPVRSLAEAVLGTTLDPNMTTGRWLLGGSLALALAGVMFKSRKELWNDVGGRALLIGVAIGALAADAAWGMLALGLLLYVGLPLLIRAHDAIPGNGFIAKRGAVMTLVLILSTGFMLVNKTDFKTREQIPLSYQDQLLSDVARLAKNQSDAKKKVKIASQWPGRTMIACMCDVFPLPAAAKDPQTQYAMMKGLDFLVFDPRQKRNEILTRNMSVLGGVTETLEIQPGGVIIHFRKPEPGPSGKQ